MTIKVTKGPPPELANNYFAPDDKLKIFGSGNTEEVARRMLDVLTARISHDQSGGVIKLNDVSTGKYVGEVI